MPNYSGFIENAKATAISPAITQSEGRWHCIPFRDETGYAKSVFVRTPPRNIKQGEFCHGR